MKVGDLNLLGAQFLNVLPSCISPVLVGADFIGKTEGPNTRGWWSHLLWYDETSKLDSTHVVVAEVVSLLRNKN